MRTSLFDRTTSGFPLSISTALAFESLFPPRQSAYDPEREIPEHIDISVYDQMWINVDTLFRNLVQAADKDALKNTGYKEAASVIVDEMNTIGSLLNHEGRGTTSPIFYVCDYEHALRNMHKLFSLRKRTSAQQLYLKDLRDKTFKELKELTAEIKFFPGSLRTSGRTSGLMLTHYPYDLLARKQFSKLDLLESNTGKLKRYPQWNTKYYPVPGKDMSVLPFYRFLLLSLGDKALIQPMTVKLRTQIMDCAEKRGWTPMTTQDKCILDLSTDLHPFDFAVIDSAKHMPA